MKGATTIDQPSEVTYEYMIWINSLITQPHGILAINEILPVVQSFSRTRLFLPGFSFDVL